MKLKNGPFLAYLFSIVAITAFDIVYLVTVIPRSPASTLVSMFAPSLSLIFWIAADARHRRRTPCFDFGLFMFLSFPVSLFWYGFWSRGGVGLIFAVALTCLLWVPSICETIVWDLLYAVN